METATTRRRRYNVDDYYGLLETGVLTEDDRVELIEGEILPMSPIGIRHGLAVRSLGHRLTLLLQERAVLSVQSPLRLDDWSEPEPDIVVLPGPIERLTESHPAATDALLVIEVADTTVRHDRGRKLPLYARFGVPEVWLVVLRRSLVEVYRGPESGRYASKTILGRGQSLSPLAFPDVTLSVDEILGPPVHTP